MKKSFCFAPLLLFYHGKCPKRWTNAGIKSKKLCSHKYYLFYYTVNIADFQGLPLVAFLKYLLLRCFVKNLFFPLLYIQKAGNEPSRLHSAAFLLPEKRKGGENPCCSKSHRSSELKSMPLFAENAVTAKRVTACYLMTVKKQNACSSFQGTVSTATIF